MSSIKHINVSITSFCIIIVVSDVLNRINDYMRGVCLASLRFVFINRGHMMYHEGQTGFQLLHLITLTNKTTVVFHCMYSWLGTSDNKLITLHQFYTFFQYTPWDSPRLSLVHRGFCLQEYSNLISQPIIPCHVECESSCRPGK